jgi:apolipoprotein D and lipocalin family protein
MGFRVILLALMGLIPILALNAQIKTVDHVDLDKYLGKWYEIGRYPAKFQKDCYSSTATYSLDKKGNIIVLNECRKGSPDGKYKFVKGKAHIVDKKTNAKLKVTFFWPFYGDYWIIDLEKDYKYAVVSEPSMKYLWILSRTPKLDPDTEKGIYERLSKWGYDTKKIIKM